MVRRLPHFCDQRLDIGDLGAVGGDGDRGGAGAEIGQGVEGFAGGGAGGGFARGDVDFGAAGLEEAGGPEGGGVLVLWRRGMDWGGEREGEAYLPGCGVEA